MPCKFGRLNRDGHAGHGEPLRVDHVSRDRSGRCLGGRDAGRDQEGDRAEKRNVLAIPIYIPLRNANTERDRQSP